MAAACLTGAAYGALNKCQVIRGRTLLLRWTSATPLQQLEGFKREATIVSAGSLWLATALGSSAAVSRSRHDSTPTASFEVRLVDLLWPQPPLACNSHQTSTPGPLS